MSKSRKELHQELVNTIQELHKLHVAEEYDEDNFEATFEMIYSACDTALDPGGSGFALGE